MCPGNLPNFSLVRAVSGRPEIGITVASVEESTAQSYGWPAGVLVTSVNQDSCAARAGLKQNDIITKIGDTNISDVSILVSVKNQYKAGETANITIWRAGETMTLQITFDEQATDTDNTVSETPAYPDSGFGSNSGNGFGSNGTDIFDPWS